MLTVTTIIPYCIARDEDTVQWLIDELAADCAAAKRLTQSLAPEEGVVLGPPVVSPAKRQNIVALPTAVDIEIDELGRAMCEKLDGVGWWPSRVAFSSRYQGEYKYFRVRRSARRMKGNLEGEANRQLERAIRWMHEGVVVENVPFLFKPQPRGAKRLLGRHPSDHISEVSWRPSQIGSSDSGGSDNDSDGDLQTYEVDEREP